MDEIQLNLEKIKLKIECEITTIRFSLLSIEKSHSELQKLLKETKEVLNGK